MSIPFKVIERGQPGVEGGGTKKFYASANSRSHVSLTDLSIAISRMSSLSRPDIMAVLEALTVMIPEHLKMGRIVQLGNLGNLGVSLNSAPSDTEAEVSGNNIKHARAVFRPGRELRNALTNATFEKVA